MGPISPDDLRFNKFGLSQQESRVLSLAMAGRIDKQIASEMGISLGTVRVYWKRIRAKVGGKRSEVIAELARNSLKLDFDGVKEESESLSRRIEALEARIRELEPYEAAFANSPLAVALLDAPTGKILRANPAFAELHGYSVDELEDESSQTLMAAAEIAGFDEGALAAEDGKPIDIRTTRLRKDGGTILTDARLVPGEGSWVLTLRETR